MIRYYIVYKLYAYEVHTMNQCVCMCVWVNGVCMWACVNECESVYAYECVRQSVCMYVIVCVYLYNPYIYIYYLLIVIT